MTTSTNTITKASKLELVKKVIDSELPRVIEYYVTNGIGYNSRRKKEEVTTPISLKEFYVHLTNFNNSINSFQEHCRRSESPHLYKKLEI